MSADAATGQRLADLADRLTAVRSRIDAAVSAAGRLEAPALIVVTKHFPASDVSALASLGVQHVGENKAQEFVAKVSELPERSALTLHFIGQLQSNKASAVAALADVVHTVDRVKVARALDRHRADSGRPLDVLLQVSLDGDPARGGVALDLLSPLVDQVAGLPNLRLRGVMAVAPYATDPDPAFARLREVADGIQRDHPQAQWISAGMSGDLEAAIRHGATHLRVGSAILGSRPSLG